MLMHFKSWLKSFDVVGKDEDFGSVDDALIDEKDLTIRYFTVKTGNWFSGEKMYISPASIESINVNDEVITTDITKEEAENAPRLEGRELIDRTYETNFHTHYGLNPYWTGPGVWGTSFTARELAAQQPVAMPEPEEDSKGEPEIYKAKDIIRYEFAAQDDSFGQVEDLLIEEDSYKVRYFVIDTRKFFGGKKVLISADWVENIDWIKAQIQTNVTKEQVENSPEYLPEIPLSREMEVDLYSYYNRAPYW